MERIAHSRPCLGKDERRVLEGVLKSGQLSQGEYVRRFEAQMAVFHGGGGAVAVSSGSAALHLALLALGVGPGDEVIVPAYVCTALLNAVRYTGADPKIVDVDPIDGNIAVACAARARGRRTKAMIVPHMFGRPADLRGLSGLGVPIIEDCAQAIGATGQGRRVGTWGTLGVFSFYTTKMIATGEGGMVIASDRRLLNRVRDLRDYDRRATYKVRYNYKMTDMAAALGVVQLQRLPGFLQRRRNIAAGYTRVLRNAAVRLPVDDADRPSVWFRYVVRTSSRTRVLKALADQGIDAAAPVYKPLHRYVSAGPCPVADQWARQAVSIPIYPALTNRQIKDIHKALRAVFVKKLGMLCFERYTISRRR